MTYGRRGIYVSKRYDLNSPQPDDDSRRGLFNNKPAICPHCLDECQLVYNPDDEMYDCSECSEIFDEIEAQALVRDWEDLNDEIT